MAEELHVEERVVHGHGVCRVLLFPDDVPGLIVGFGEDVTVMKNAKPESIAYECEQSLKRLGG